MGRVSVAKRLRIVPVARYADRWRSLRMTFGASADSTVEMINFLNMGGQLLYCVDMTDFVSCDPRRTNHASD